MTKLRYAYNTNGCANHRLSDALELIAEAGYDGVALTLDWHHLDPFAVDWVQQTLRLREQLQRLGLDTVIETGARFLLDPHHKHEPTLLHPTPEGRARRVDFLKRAIDIGSMLDAEAVSFWAGVPQPGITTAMADAFLREGVNALAAYASAKNITLAMEPEPGMHVETLEDWEHLRHNTLEALTLALDVGHIWVTGEMDPAQAVELYAHHCGTAALEGMDRGVHIHRPLHEGDMDIAAVLRAFQAARFDRLICIELSRESHRAHRAIFESIATLRQLETELLEQPKIIKP